MLFLRTYKITNGICEALFTKGIKESSIYHIICVHITTKASGSLSQCAICEKIINKIFNVDPLDDSTMKSDKTQFLAKLIKAKSRVKSVNKLKNSIFKGLGGVEDNPPENISTKLDKSALPRCELIQLNKIDDNENKKLLTKIETVLEIDTLPDSIDTKNINSDKEIVSKATDRALNYEYNSTNLKVNDNLYAVTKQCFKSISTPIDGIIAKLNVSEYTKPESTNSIIKEKFHPHFTYLSIKNKKERPKRKHKVKKGTQPGPAKPYLNPLSSTYEPTITDKPLFIEKTSLDEKQNLLIEHITQERDKVLETFEDVNENMRFAVVANLVEGKLADVNNYNKDDNTLYMPAISNKYFDSEATNTNVVNGTSNNHLDSLSSSYEPVITDKPLFFGVTFENDHVLYVEQTAQHKEKILEPIQNVKSEKKMKTRNNVEANIVEEELADNRKERHNQFTPDISKDVFDIGAMANTNEAKLDSKDESKDFKKTKISLETLLKAIRRRNRKQVCQGKNKPSPCPAPPPSCPPDLPKPTTPTPCPKPTSNPTTCPPPSDCPPPPKKCFHKLEQDNNIFSLDLPDVKPNNETDLSEIEIKISTNGNKSVNIIENVINKVFGIDKLYVRGFEPWTPLPSWPIPELAVKMRCPNKAKFCKPPSPPKLSDPCQNKPCPGFPKRRT